MFSIISLVDFDSFYTNRQAAIALVTATYDDEATKGIYQNVSHRIHAQTNGEEEDMKAEWDLFDCEREAYEEELSSLVFLAIQNGVPEADEETLNRFLGLIEDNDQ